MNPVTLEEAQAKLPELLGRMARGEALPILSGVEVVARLVRENGAARRLPPPGFARDVLTVVAEDDEHLADFAEYMP